MLCMMAITTEGSVMAEKEGFLHVPPHPLIPYLLHDEEGREGRRKGRQRRVN